MEELRAPEIWDTEEASELALILRAAMRVGDQHRRETLDRLMVNTFFADPPDGVDGQCWVWNGPTSGDTGRGAGYGRVSYGGRTWAVHRLAFALCCGPLQPGKQVDHRCVRRLCWNPVHLNQVTHRKNQMLRDLRRLTNGNHL